METEDVIFFYKDSCEKESLYKRYKEMIERQGFIQLTDNNIPVKAGNNTVKIYNPYLFFILTTEKLPVLNCETKEDTIINGFDYLKTFIQGYNEGMKYFIREFEVSPDTRYKNPQYAKDIYLNHFHTEGGEGWEVIKRSHPGTFNHESIKKLGFDSGIVNKVEELIKKSPALFENFDTHNKEVPGLNHLLTIPTKANPDQILDFWLKLTGNNEKGQPYWENEKEIEHFVNQNFDIFSGVDEIKEFNPNMSKSELNHVTWTFYHKYGMSKTKKQYESLLMLNFTKFKDDSNVYSNIKDQSNEHLKRLFK